MEVEYIAYQPRYKEDLFQMIQSLYAEDPEGQEMSDEKMERTVEFLHLHPGHGRIVLISSRKVIIGYSILTYFWSNEYGGLVLFIDELYMKEEHRGKGIGTRFIKNLLKTERNTCTAAQIEVFPNNRRAFDLYIKIGFQPVHNKFVRYIFNK